jgi:hypothetical protein
MFDIFLGLRGQRDEVVAGIRQLRDELALLGQTSPGVDAAVDRIAGALGIMDAIHDDVLLPPEPEPGPVQGRLGRPDRARGGEHA